MLSPLSPGLTGEEAMRVIGELQDAQRRLDRLKASLVRLVHLVAGIGAGAYFIGPTA
jgi:hypothetical protein